MQLREVFNRLEFAFKKGPPAKPLLCNQTRVFIPLYHPLYHVRIFFNVYGLEIDAERPGFECTLKYLRVP